MPRHLILDLEAPLLAFGRVVVDAYGVIDTFPGRAAMAGLLANALGFDRTEAARHQRLQDRLVHGAVVVREGKPLRDFQTARLGAADKGWTTRGRPEGRAGGAGTYSGPHIRYRDYHADAFVCVALRLEPADEAPDLDTIAAALDEPARPLFLGRKPCLPATRIGAGILEAPTILAALEAALPAAIARRSAGQAARRRTGERGPVSPTVPARWPAGEGETDRGRETDITDERDWPAGVHAGSRRVVEGEILWPEAGT